MSTHALASLNNYSDSEPEIEEEDQVLADEKPDKSSDESDSRVPTPETVEPTPVETEPEPPKPVEVFRVMNLVSYNDDAAEDDEDEAEIRINDSPPPTGDEIQLPPEPTGRISPRMLEKVQRLHERMESGLDMNAVIQNKKEFRNPSIYEKLIQFCGLNELGTNYPPRIYDPLKWGKESFYEELAKIQNTEMEKREKEKKDKSKLEILTGMKKPGVEDDIKKRKSKWDQVGSGPGGGMMRGSGLLQPTLTAAISGTKSTVISAFGSLPSKKPKL